MTIQMKTGMLFFIFLVVSFNPITSEAGNDRFEQAKKYLDKGINTYKIKTVVI